MKSYIIFLFLVISSRICANNPDVKTAQNFNQNTKWAFEENKGQVTGEDSAKVKFFYKQGNLTMFLLNTGIAYQFEKRHYPEGYKPLTKFASLEERKKHNILIDSIKVETYRMDIELIGANQNSEIIKEGKSSDYIQYYNHNALEVHSYQKITYKNIYNNIDWVIYKTETGIKYDFAVRPRGNPQDIKIKANWAGKMLKNNDGSINIKCTLGEIKENPPISFQDGTKVQTNFKLNNDLFAFDLDTYDSSKNIIIDPIIGWSTYYGDTSNDFVTSTCTDVDNNIYITGGTESINKIASGGHQVTFGGGLHDAFLVKFDVYGNRIWATYYGGSGHDVAFSCATDKVRNIFIVGSTSSSSNIAFGGHQNTYGGLYDAFLTKFDLNGTRLWGTYYGGYSYEIGANCITDSKNNIYFTGTTVSPSGIAFGGFRNSKTWSGDDAYLVKFSSSGTRIWATYYGGSSDDEGHSCAVDRKDNIYLAGSTESNSNISSSGHQNSFGGNIDGFLVKFNSIGNRLWATYYGGTGIDWLYPSTTDSNDNVYIAGYTSSSSNIAIGGHQNNHYPSGAIDFIAFLAKLDSSGTRLWGTYYGNSAGDEGNSCKVDKDNNIILCGYTSSTVGIASLGFDNSHNGAGDAFLVKFNPNGVRIWGTYFGGAGDDYGEDCSIDNNGGIIIAGRTPSTSNIAVSGFQNNFGGGFNDGFLAKIMDSSTPKIIITQLFNDTVCLNTPAGFNAVVLSGGYSPKYRWYLNNNIIDTNSVLYVTNIKDSDTIKCLLISNNPLRRIDSVWSNRIIVNIKLPSKMQIKDTVCSNIGYVFKGNKIFTTGMYKDTLFNSIGCDSIIILDLTVKIASHYAINDTICQGMNYTFNEKNLTNSGTYFDTFINSVGCDSFITLNLIIKPTNYKIIYDTICQGSKYLFKGVNITNSGTYFDTFINSVGCDSFITLNLIIKPTNYKIIYDTICQGSKYLFKGVNITNSGTYLDTFINSVGCDSFLTLHLFVKQTSTKIIYDTICKGINYFFKGINLTNSGTYLDTLKNSQGCDSFLTLHLFVKQTSVKNLYDTICQDDSVLFNSDWRKNVGVYQDTMLNSIGCDSIINFFLHVKSKSSSKLNVTRCFNDPYFFNGNNLTIDGTYYDTLINSKGCDSFIELNLVFIKSLILPDFDTSLSLCYSYNPPHLNNHSPNGIIGTWNPLIIDNKNSASYVFTPDPNQCATSTTLKVKINPLPSIKFDYFLNDTICRGDSVRITLNGDISYKYHWTNGSTQNYFKDYPIENTDYVVTTSNGFGCSRTDTAEVYIRSAQVKIVGQNKVNKGNEVVLSAVSNMSIIKYMWSPVELFKDQQNKQVSLKVEYPLVVELNVKDSFGCIASDKFPIQLVGRDILIPDAFSPNKDGINDIFVPIFKEHIKVMTFKIFNRWGELVYNYDQKNKIGWDGEYNGENCPAGIYIYYTEYSVDSKFHKIEGNVTLIR